MRATIRKAVKRVPIVRDLVRERERLKAELAALRRSSTFAIPGVDLREGEQLELLERFKDYYREQPFRPHKVADRRYYFENDASATPTPSSSTA